MSDENRLDLLFAGFIVFLLAGVVTVAMGIRRELRTGVIGQHPQSGLWRRHERPAGGLPVCARPRAALSFSALSERGRTTMLNGLNGLVDVDRGIISREIFVNEEIYRREQEQIFARAWLFIGHESLVPVVAR